MLQPPSDRAKAARWTKSDVIASLAATGMPAAAIAAIAKSTPASVRSRISQLRRRGLQIPRERERIEVELSPCVAGLLDQEAGRRGVSPADLATALLTLLLAERMVDAVMDD